MTEKEQKHRKKGRRQMRVCRHHGLTEFYCNSTNRENYKCLACKREENRRRKEGRKPNPLPGCPNYLGIHIAEQILQKAFDKIERAHPMEHWDFICGKGFKVDCKSSTLKSSKAGCKSLGWGFNIKRNKYPDYFCLMAFDNTPKDVAEDPEPVHIWLVPGNADIEGRPLNSRKIFWVTPGTIAKLEPYRRTNMEGKIIKCCNYLKGEEGSKEAKPSSHF